MPESLQNLSALCLEAKPVVRVWGGTRLTHHLGLQTSQPIGELWLAYDENPVKTGPYKGQVLAQLIPKLGADFIGEVPAERYGLELPLLVKFLDSGEWLSVQVHPDDSYAHRVEAASGFHGKTEAWQILGGQGEIVYGLSEPIERAALRQAAQDGSIWGKLARHSLKPGQTVYVPAGTIHALGPGLVLYEVQQRSDLTYRLYDFGRPRELHLDKGVEVSKVEPTSIPQTTPLVTREKTTLLASRAFVLESYTLEDIQIIQAPQESFLLLTLTSGKAHWAEGELGWGDTLLIGAGRQVELKGQAQFLGAFIPSEERLEGYPSTVRV